MYKKSDSKFLNKISSHKVKKNDSEEGNFIKRVSAAKVQLRKTTEMRLGNCPG